jgi:hypothetical protein
VKKIIKSILNKRAYKKLIAVFLAALMILPIMPSEALGQVARSSVFSDLAATHWAYNEIIDLSQRGIINGFPDGTYRPEEALTKEQFARLVVSLLGSPQARTEGIFDDVPQDRWSNPYITDAVNRLIIFPSDYGENLGASEPITREEAAVWMVRAMGLGYGNNTPTFNDTAAITHKAEIAFAVEIGLIAGMPGNLFDPLGHATRAQGAVLITRMSNILDGLRWDGEEIHHHVYQDNVTVITNPSAYSFTEENDMLIITVQNPTDAVRRLAVGETFVLQPGESQPWQQGVAGHVVSIDNQVGRTIIIAGIPDSLEDIFVEYHFKGQANVLELMDEFILSEELQGVAGIEIVRNPTRLLSINFTRDTVLSGVTISGGASITFHSPTITYEYYRSWLGVPTGFEHFTFNAKTVIDMNVKASGSFDHVIEIGKIEVTVKGIAGFEVPIGIRINAEGQISLEFTSTIDKTFGLTDNNRPFGQVSAENNLEFDASAKVSVSLHVQVIPKILCFKVYGVQGEFGKGFETNTAMQARCHLGGLSNRGCLVINMFDVRKISSAEVGLGKIEAFQFSIDLAANQFDDFRYITFSPFSSLKSCPHPAQQTPPNTQNPEPEPQEPERAYTDRWLFPRDGFNQSMALQTGNVNMLGERYTGTIYTRSAVIGGRQEVSFNLNRNYDVFIYGIGVVDNTRGTLGHTEVQIYLDGVLGSRHFFALHAQPTMYELNVTGVRVVRIEIYRGNFTPDVALFSMRVRRYN